MYGERFSLRKMSASASLQSKNTAERGKMLDDAHIPWLRISYSGFISQLTFMTRLSDA